MMTVHQDVKTQDGKIIEYTLPEYFKGEHDFIVVQIIQGGQPDVGKKFHETVKDVTDKRLVPTALGSDWGDVIQAQMIDPKDRLV